MGKYQTKCEKVCTEQTIKCIAKYGHLYDEETGKRIVFVEGSSCMITGAEYKYPNVEIPEGKTKIESGHIKLLSENTELYYDLLQPRKKEKDKELNKTHEKFRVKCKLLEDLHVKRTEKEGYRFNPCKCITISSNIPYFEPIFGTSLAELFRKTSILYNEGYTSANGKVAERFFLENGENLEKVCDKAFVLKERLAKAKAKLVGLGNL